MTPLVTPMHRSAAWLNDELNESHRIARVLTASARWALAGGASGMIALGLLARATNAGTAIVVPGVGMALLAVFVTARFKERNFTPTRQKRWAASRVVFQHGITRETPSAGKIHLLS